MKYPNYSDAQIEKRYTDAREIYDDFGINTDTVLRKLDKIRISMHCWQGDDVGGFECREDKTLTGGILATGSKPGKARNADELRQDAEKAFSLIPGRHRFNLHAIYLETGGRFVDRNEIEPEHFVRWVDWAKSLKIKLDFNPTFFSHPKSASGFTLSSPDKAIRKFWIEHAKRCRFIAEYFSKELNSVVINNTWIPDGAKDIPADRWNPREILIDSLDEIFRKKYGSKVKDSVEGKLFGIGSEEYVVGSNDFYLSYALTRKKLLCMDMGHYHPTEAVHDKLSTALAFMPEVLLHISRPVRWDSDHVVILNDDLENLAREIVRGRAIGEVYLATDFFDASINRIGAWVIGMRSTQKALLNALLEPAAVYRSLERDGRKAEMLALMEEMKSLPAGAVWDYFCLKHDVPVSIAWLNDLRTYEQSVLSRRS